MGIVVHFAMLKLQLDDPLDAVAVHGAGGLVGILCVPWFMVANLEAGERGILWDGHNQHPWLVLGYNLAGALVIVLWSGFWSCMLFGSLYYLDMLRVSTEDEFQYTKDANSNTRDCIPGNMSSNGGLGATH